jgi:hypothetical protein
VEKGRKERYNRLSYFDFDTPSPLASTAGIPNLHGGLRFVGVEGNAERQFDTDWNNFAPRFDFAYSVDSQTVVRGGYGIFFLPYIGAASGWASGINGFLSFTPQVTSLDGFRPVDLLSNPFPNGLQEPTAPDSGLLTNIGQDFGASGRDGAVDRGARASYSQQWNLNVQRQLPGRIALEAAYVGNKGTKLTDGPRRELLDHIILLNEFNLCRLGRDYLAYYHQDRTHIGLNKNTPTERAIESRHHFQTRIVSTSRLGGLHHRYRWSEAA